MKNVQLKTMEYLDLHEVLKTVETATKRAGLANRVWESLMKEQLFDGNDSFGYVPIEDSHEELIEEYGQHLGDDYEALKQAVAHISLEKIQWLSRWQCNDHQSRNQEYDKSSSSQGNCC